MHIIALNEIFVDWLIFGGNLPEGETKQKEDTQDCHGLGQVFDLLISLAEEAGPLCQRLLGGNLCDFEQTTSVLRTLRLPQQAENLVKEGAGAGDPWGTKVK